MERLDRLVSTLLLTCVLTVFSGVNTNALPCFWCTDMNDCIEGSPHTNSDGQCVSDLYCKKYKLFIGFGYQHSGELVQDASECEDRD